MLHNLFRKRRTYKLMNVNSQVEAAVMAMAKAAQVIREDMAALALARDNHLCDTAEAMGRLQVATDALLAAVVGAPPAPAPVVSEPAPTDAPTEPTDASAQATVLAAQ